MPTLKEVAHAAGVSMATVSRSLNGSPLIPEKTRRAVCAVADRLGYEFNAHARSLVTRRVGTIGIILPPEYDTFSINLYHGTLHNALRSVLESNDIDLIVAFQNNHFTGGNNIEKLVRRKKVDGLIIVEPVLARELVEFLHTTGTPFVLAHYPPPADYLSDVDMIYPDNELGGYLAGSHVGRIGRRRPLVLSARGTVDLEYRLRMEGLRRGLSEYGIHVAKEDVLRCGLSTDSGYEAVRGIGTRVGDFDAIIAVGSDLVAMGALFALKDLGVRVSEDCAVVGYDDTEVAASMRPPLTAVHQPREELSRATCERLIELIQAHRGGGPAPAAKRIVLAPRLEIRESSAGPAVGARLHPGDRPAGDQGDSRAGEV